MKKLIVKSMIALTLLSSVVSGVFAEEFNADQKLIDVIYNKGAENNMWVTILDKKHYDEENQNYERIIFSEDNQPFIDENGRTQMPMRKIADELDFTVDWNDAEKKITLSKDGQNIVFQIGNTDYYVNGGKQSMDTSPVIVNDCTFIPLRYLGEAVGYTVEFTDRSLVYNAESVTTDISDMWKL